MLRVTLVFALASATALAVQNGGHAVPTPARGFTYQSLQDLANDLQYNQLKRDEIIEPKLTCKKCTIVTVENARIESVNKSKYGPVVLAYEPTDGGRGVIFGAIYLTNWLPVSITANFRHDESISITGIVFEYDPKFKPNVEALRMRGIVVPLDGKGRAAVEAIIHAPRAHETKPLVAYPPKVRQAPRASSREQIIAIDNWWSVDYARNVCQLPLHSCDEDPKPDVLAFESRIGIAMKADRSCSGIALMGYAGPNARLSAKQQKSLITARWQLMFDFVPGQAKQNWTMADRRTQHMTNGVATPTQIAHSICMTVKRPGRKGTTASAASRSIGLGDPGQRQ